MSKSSGAAQSAEKIEIFEKRERAEPADLFIDALSNEDTGISIAEPEETKQRIDGRKLPGSARGAIKSQAEVPARDRFFFKRFRDFVEGAR